MIRRDELLRHAGAVTATVVISASLSFSGVQAQTARPLAHETRQADTISVPREILPWRRDVERRADDALARAERTLAGGRKGAGERQLADIVRDYPKTYAGKSARERLERIRQAALWRGGLKRGALGVTGQIGSDGDSAAFGDNFSRNIDAGLTIVFKTKFACFIFTDGKLNQIVTIQIDAESAFGGTQYDPAKAGVNDSVIGDIRRDECGYTGFFNRD